MPKVKLSGNFDNDYQNLQKELPDIKDIVDQRVIWFKKNPQDTRLDNHHLTKRMEDKWAFSIIDDIRIIYKWTNKTTARFLAVGSHIKVYRRENIKKSPKR